MDKPVRIEKKVGNVYVEMVDNGNGIINFWEVSRTRTKGHAVLDVATRTWQKCHSEFGPSFKAQILVAFGL